MPSYQIDRAKWRGLSIFEQMGNAGAEVGRAFAAMRRGDGERAEAAFYRGLDLLDATAEVCAVVQPQRAKEILRARECFVRAITENHDDPKLEAYFMHFAVAARRQLL